MAILAQAVLVDIKPQPGGGYFAQCKLAVDGAYDGPLDVYVYNLTASNATAVTQAAIEDALKVEMQAHGVSFAGGDKVNLIL